MWQSHIYSLNKRGAEIMASWRDHNKIWKYNLYCIIFKTLPLKKVTVAMMTILSVPFFLYFTKVHARWQRPGQVENTKSGGGGEGGFTMAWYHVIHELLLIGCSLVGCLVSVSWLSHCSELYKFAYFLPRSLPVRRSTAVRIIWKWPLHWRFLYFL